MNRSSQLYLFSTRTFFLFCVLGLSHIDVSYALTIGDLTPRESHSLECFCHDASSPTACKKTELNRLQKTRRITKLDKLNKYYRTALFAFCDLTRCEGPVSLNQCLLDQLIDFKHGNAATFRFDDLSNTTQSSLYSKCQNLEQQGLKAVSECTVKKYIDLRTDALTKRKNDGELKKQEVRLAKETLKKQETRLRKSQQVIDEKQRELQALIDSIKENNPKRTDSAKLYSKIAPSVYMLVAWTNQTDPSATGSAVAVTNKLALTTCHIFKEHPHMELRTDNQRLPISIYYRNEKSDACIVKNMSGALKPIAGTRSYESIVIGERIYALGSPEGLFNTFTEGLLSGKRTQDNQSLIQFSAPVTGGASGGGIFDTNGKLIGIIMKGQEKGNLGFAIPVEQFKKGK